jgi:hypothetical protein
MLHTAIHTAKSITFKKLSCQVFSKQAYANFLFSIKPEPCPVSSTNAIFARLHLPFILIQILTMRRKQLERLKAELEAELARERDPTGVSYNLLQCTHVTTHPSLLPPTSHLNFVQLLPKQKERW